MRSLFQRHLRRFRRSPSRPRRGTHSGGHVAEQLEQRIALAADIASGLQQATAISLDTANASPAPIVFEHAAEASTGADVLVVNTVAHGFVQKWDAAQGGWLDITTEPVSSDPRDLLQFLAQRTFRDGDRLQWVPASGGSGGRVFDVVNWSGDTTPAPATPLPAGVSNVAISATGEAGSLQVTWSPPASGDVSSYSVRLRSAGVSETVSTTTNAATFTNLAPLEPYAIDVWASNDSGDGPVETAFHTLLDIRTVGDHVTAWDIRRSLLPQEPTDPQGNLLTPLATPWGDRLGFPGVSYEAIWAATPDSPADVPSLTLPASALGTDTDALSDGRSIAMWVQATGPGVLLSSTVETSSGSSVEVPYLWIDTDGNVNGGFYGSDAFAYNTGQTILSYQTLRGDTVIGSPLAITGQVPVIDNNWHHIALVADSDTQSLYIDGLLQGTAKPQVLQPATALVSSLYGNTISIPLDEIPQAGDTFSARIFQDETLSFTLTSTGPLRAVTPLAVSATDVVTPGSSYTPVASATLLVPASGTPQLQIVMQDAVHAQDALSVMLLYTNAAGSRFQIAPSTAELTAEISDYQVGTSVFPASAGAPLPQVSYPQPFIGAIDDLAVWQTALPQSSVQAAMTAPVDTAVNGVVLPSGATLAGIAPPSFALDFSNWQQGSSGSTYDFANAAPQGDSTAVAMSTLLTVGTPATIPASPFSNQPGAQNYLPRLGNAQNYGIGLMTPLDTGSVRVERGSPYTAQVALAQGDLLTFALNGGQPTTVAITVTDEFGTVSTETISTGNPVTLGAAYTGTVKVTLDVPTDSLIASVPVTYSQLPGGVNQLQPLLSVYEQRQAVYTSFESAYADPTIPTINQTSNFNGVAAPLATGAADYFPLWSDTTYFPTSATTEAGKSAYAEQLSAAYEALVSANDGLSFANLNFQDVDNTLSIPETLAIDLATAYRVAFGEEPPRLPAGATSFTPSASDQPAQAIYKFFSNVNRWRERANTALETLASSIASIAPQAAPYEIASLIASNQAAFVSGQTDGIVSEAEEEDLGNIAKESSIELGIKGTGAVVEKVSAHALEHGTKLGKVGVEGTALTGGLAVEMGLDMLNGWLKIKREPESPTSSVYVSFVPVIEAMTQYDSLEYLAQEISENSDAFARRIETQLTSPAYLQSIYSNFGLLKALAGVSGDGVEQLADSGALDNAAAEFSAHQAWSAMVPAAFSWEPVAPSEFPTATMQNIAEAYGWTEEPVQINGSSSENPDWMATGDFNADGYPDLVLSNNGSENLLVLYAQPNLDGNQTSVGYTSGWQYLEASEASGDYTKVVEFDEPEQDTSTPTGVAVADFNNDGRDDFVVNFQQTSNAAIWLGSAEVTSSGSLATPEYAGSLNLNGGTSPQQVVVADFNNDGWMDFASACKSSGSVVVAINTTGLPEDQSFSGIGPVSGNGHTNTLNELRFTTYNVAVSRNANIANIATGDLNNDGFADLAFTGDQGLSFLVSSADSTSGTWSGFGDVTTTLAGMANLTDIAIGDFDGDGKADDLAFLGTTTQPLSASMTGGNQGNTAVPQKSVNGVWATGLWLVLGEPADYTASSASVMPQWMGYGAISSLTTIPKAVKYGEFAAASDQAGLSDGLTYVYLAQDLKSLDIAITPDPVSLMQSFWSSPAVFSPNQNSGSTQPDWIWNDYAGIVTQLSIGAIEQGMGFYTSLAVSSSGMLAAASGSDNGNRLYSQVSWSNNVLTNAPLATFLPDDGTELAYLARAGELPGGYDADEFALAAISSMQAGVPTFMPVTQYGLPSKIASPGFFLAAVPAMVNDNGTLIDGTGRSIVGWNLVDNNGNPIAFETAEQLFGLITPATETTERGADVPLPAVLPQLWEPIDRVLEFANPTKPLKAYNGMWYADTKAANSAVTSLANAFFLWGRDNASYHTDGLLTEAGLASFPTFTDDDYTVVLHPAATETPELHLPAPTDLTIATSGTSPALTTTFSWTAPTFASATPVLYTARVYDGQNGAFLGAVETMANEAVFAGLASPDTSYYTVTAAVPGATSTVAGFAPWIQGNDAVQDAIRNNVFVGVANEGVPFVGSGLNGTGLTYNYSDLSDSLGYRGIDFALLGSNTPNMLASNGQTIAIKGTTTDGTAYNVIHMAAAAVGRDLSDVELEVHFESGTTSTWVQSFSSWKAPAGSTGESIIASTNTAIASSGVAIPFQTLQSDGSVGPGQYHLYGYSFLVPAGETVESITLPDNQFLSVLDIKLGLVGETQTSAGWSEWNAFGITSSNKQVPNNQGFDSQGQYYDGDSLSSTLSWDLGNGNAIDIALGDINNDGATVNNFVLANGQTITLSTDNIVGVSLAAAYTGDRGDESTVPVSIQVNFDDGSTGSWDLTLYPWIYQDQGAPPAGHPPILSTSEGYRRQTGNFSNNDYTYIYGYQYNSPSAAKIVSLTLPNDDALGILGLTVETLGSSSAGLTISPPTSPQGLAAVLGPGVGDMTLGWRPPANSGGAPIESYTATVWQGLFTQSVTTASPSATFSGLTRGNGPVYFTVQASNAAGEGSVAELLTTEDGIALPLTNAGVGFSTDGTSSNVSGFDGAGNTYSWDAMGDLAAGGARVDNTLLWNGVTFDLGNPNQPDFTWASGQTLTVSGTGNVLNLAAAAVNGGQQSQRIVLTFTDGSSAVWTQSFSDWCDPQSHAGEQTISQQSYRNTASGGQNSTANAIYGYSYTLPAGQTLASITLPNNANLRLLDMQMSTSTSVNLSGSYTSWGIANGQTQAANNEGFDHGGHYYYSGDLPSFVTWSGATFDVGPSSTSKHGTNNFVQARGQTIDLPTGTFGWLYLAAAAANGSQLNQALTLHFSDGSQETWTQSLSDWCAYEAFDGQRVISTQSSWVDQVGNVKSQTNRVYGYAYALPIGKTLTAITLPDNADVGILAITLV